MAPVDHDVLLVVVENLELAEKSDLHASTVPAPPSSRPLSLVTVRGAQLGEPLLGGPGDVSDIDGPSEQVDDLVVAPEVRKVLEREVDRPSNSATRGQLA